MKRIVQLVSVRPFLPFLARHLSNHSKVGQETFMKQVDMLKRWHGSDSRALALQPMAWIEKHSLSLKFKDGAVSTFDGIWLRDHCRCSSCFHELTKQRLLDTSEIPLDIAPSHVHVSPSTNTLAIKWSNDHTSTYSLDWLRAHSYSPRLIPNAIESTTRTNLKLWSKSLADNLPVTPYEDIMASDSGLAHWLSNIDSFGIAFVSGVPPNAKASEALARRISFVRESHYGQFWELVPDMGHGDTAYSSIALPAHTDTTYFTDPVGLQFFHLLAHDGKGGQSLYVDGFNAALQLKQSHKWAFDILSSLKIPAHSAGDLGTLIQPSVGFPILGLDSHGRLSQIRFNNDDRSVLDSLTASQVRDFYAALREWTRLIKHPDNEIWVQLKPGFAVMLDNWRVLHGRSSFTGNRRLCGSYHNYDDYRSRFKILCHRDSLSSI